MKRYAVTVLAAFLGFCACEYELTLDDLDTQGRIFVDAVFGAADSAFVKVGFTIPSVGERVLPDTPLELEIHHNGQIVSYEEVEDFIPSYVGERCFLVKCPSVPGDEFIVKASAEGYEPVVSRTFIPEPVAEAKAGYRMASVYESSTSRVRSAIEVSVQFGSEDDSDDSCYAVQVLCIPEFQEVPDDTYFIKKESWDKVAYPEVFLQDYGTLSSIEPPTCLENFLGGPIFIMDERTDGECMETKIHIRPNDWEYTYIWNEEAGESERFCYLKYVYSVRVFRLSRSHYNYLKSLYRQEHEPVVMVAALSPVALSYTNVTGGAGYVCGISFFQTPWTEF